MDYHLQYTGWLNLISILNFKFIYFKLIQAVLISYCLQSMVEEMLLKREGKKFRSEGLSLRYNTSPNSNLSLNKQNGNSSITVPILADNENFNVNYLKKDGSRIPLSINDEQSNDNVSKLYLRIKNLIWFFFFKFYYKV